MGQQEQEVYSASPGLTGRQGSSQGGGDSDTSQARPLLSESSGRKMGRPSGESLGASRAEVTLQWGQGRVGRRSQQPKGGKNRNLLGISTGPGQGGREPTPFLLFQGAQHSNRARPRCPWRCQVATLIPKCFRSCSRNMKVSTVWGTRRTPAGTRPLKKACGPSFAVSTAQWKTP